MVVRRHDLIIKNGQVSDGSGTSRKKADVGIEEDQIKTIGNLSGYRADVFVDASNRIVGPSFIDVHTHDDHALLSAPGMSFKTSQGVTTVVVGNCGISLAPLRLVGDRPPAPLDLLRDGYNFPRMADFVDHLEATPPATKAAYLCGHTTLRVGAMENLMCPATEDEISLVKDNLSEALDSGAVGLSTGLAYDPAKSAPTREILSLAEILGPADALYTTHLRDEGSNVIKSSEEALLIGRE